MTDGSAPKTGPRSAREQLIIRLEEEATCAAPLRAALVRYELGRLLEAEPNLQARALEVYRSCGAFAPAARAVTRLCMVRGEAEGLLPALEAEQSVARDDELRAALLVERALVQRTEPGDADAARQDLRRALELEPGQPVALEALGELSTAAELLDDLAPLLRRQIADLDSDRARRGLLRLLRASRPDDRGEEAALLEELAARPGEADAAGMMVQAGRLRRERPGEGEQALASLKRALPLTPRRERGPLLAELASLLVELGRHAEAAAAYSEAAAVLDDPAEAARVSLELGRIQLHELEDSGAAAASLGKALERDPGLEPARELLEELLEQGGDQPALAAHLRADIERGGPRAPWAGLRLGHLLEGPLEDPKGAVEAYQRVLGLRRGWRPALLGQARAHRAMGEPALALTTYEALLLGPGEADEKIWALEQVAELAERELDDPARAAAAHERILALDPDHTSSRERLARLYEALGRWSHLAATLGESADRTDDRQGRLRLLGRLAHVHLNQTDDAGAALEALQALLELDPLALPARQQALRLLGASGQHEGRLALLRGIADHLEPGYERTRTGLRVARALGHDLQRWQEAGAEAAAVLEQCAGQPDPGDRAWRRLGAEAADLLWAALGRGAGAGDTARLLALMPAPQDPADAAAFHCRLARRLAREGEQEAAHPHLESALEAAPARDEVRELVLAQVAADRGLEGLARRLGEQLEALSPGGDRDTLLHRLLWVEARGGLDPARAAALLDQARASEQDPGARAVLEHCLARLGQWPRLASLLSRRGADAGSGAPRETPALLFSTACQLVAAGLTEDRLDDLEQAAHLAFLVLERQPRQEEALAIMERHYRAAANPGGLAQILERRLAEVERAPERAALLTGLGAVHARAGALERAAARFREAAEALETYLPAARGWARACANLERLEELCQARAAEAGASLTRERRVAATLEAARLGRQQPGGPSGLQETLRQALDLAPDNLDLWLEMARVCRAGEQWDQLISANRRLLELSPEPDQAAALHFELGRVLHGKLGQADEAARELTHGLRLAPHDMEALALLADIRAGQERWGEAVRCLEKVVDLEHRRERLVGLHLRLARLHDDGLGDAERAADWCRRALSQDPGQMEAADLLSDLLRRLGKGPAREAHLRATLEVHRLRLDREPGRTGPYRALASLLGQLGDADGQAVVSQAQAALAAPASEPPPEEGGLASAPESSLDEADLQGPLTHPDLPLALARLLQAAGHAARELSPPAPSFEPPGQRVTGRTHPRLARLVDATAAALGLTEELAVFLDPGAGGSFRLEDAAPPALVLGHGLEAHDSSRLRFHVARLVARVRMGHLLPLGLGAQELGRLVAALIGLSCRVFDAPYPEEQLEPLRARLDRTLDRDARRAMASPALELSDRPFAPERWLQGMRLSEDRIGLLLGGSPGAALAAVRAAEQGAGAPWQPGGRGSQLLRFAVSEAHLELRRRLLPRR